MSRITTHVLDLARGRPAAGVNVTLERALPDGSWTALGATATDDNGRTGDLAGGAVEPGAHRLVFASGAYFAAQGVAAFHPSVTVTFEIVDAAQHHHVPLLVAPFGYSTYRGS
jgi:5-hydroxyisourate hydrolase